MTAGDVLSESMAEKSTAGIQCLAALIVVISQPKEHWLRGTDRGAVELKRSREEGRLGAPSLPELRCLVTKNRLRVLTIMTRLTAVGPVLSAHRLIFAEECIRRPCCTWRGGSERRLCSVVDRHGRRAPPP